MNEKGFTLVELLAVIIILSVLALITTISTNTTINNSRTKLTEIQIKNIEKAAESYYLKEAINTSYYDKEEIKSCVNIEYLIEKGYIDSSEIKNPKGDELMEGSVKITYKSNQYTYEYQETACTNDDLGIICEGVKTATNGNVPTGKYLPGDEYICKVKSDMEEGYRFYVLSEEEEKVNLIMEREIDSKGAIATTTASVVWVSLADYKSTDGLEIDYNTDGNTDRGPITVMKYLYNATKDWDNIENVIIDYTDECKNYGNIKTTENKTVIKTVDDIETINFINLKARLPYKKEILANNSSVWLGGYLSSSVGYHLMNSSLSGSACIDFVLNGEYKNDCTKKASFVSAVRPVISISKTNIK